jgi:hypothetical protein
VFFNYVVASESSWNRLAQFTGIFYSQGIVDYEFIPAGRTMNKEMYIDILRRLRDTVRRKRHKKWRTSSCFPLHDNAPAHRSVLVMDILAKSNVTTLEHPPYTSDLAAADLYLFPRLKSALKGQRLCDTTDIKNAT